MEVLCESEDNLTEPWKEEGEDECGNPLLQWISSKPLNKAMSTCEGDRSLIVRGRVGSQETFRSGLGERVWVADGG